MEDEILRAESNQRQHYATLEHYEKMNLIVEQCEYNLFSMLKPKLFKDGNQWCVLYGDDLQTGISGFGETPLLAILDFNKKWTVK